MHLFTKKKKYKQIINIHYHIIIKNWSGEKFILYDQNLLVHASIKKKKLNIF